MYLIYGRTLLNYVAVWKKIPFSIHSNSPGIFKFGRQTVNEKLNETRLYHRAATLVPLTSSVCVSVK